MSESSSEGISPSTPQIEKPVEETANLVKQKIQDLDIARKTVKKEVEKIIRIGTGEPGTDKQGAPIVIGEHEEAPEEAQSLVSKIESESVSDAPPSKDALGIRRALRDIVKTDIERINSELLILDPEIDRIRKILLSDPFYDIPGPFETTKNLSKNQQKEFASLKNRLAQLQDKKQELIAKRQKNYEKSTGLSKEQKEDAGELLFEQILPLKDKYQELLTTLLSDKKIVSEVLRTYISSIIEPQIDKLIKNASNKHPVVRETINKLNEVLGKIQSDGITDNKSREELLDIFYKDYEFNSLLDSLRLLQTGEEYRIINRLVSTLFQQDLEDMSNPNYSHIFRIYEYTSNEPDLWPWAPEKPVDFISHFGTMYGRTLLASQEDRFSNIKDINSRLATIMNSPSTYGLFKERVDYLYKRNHEFFLEKSLTDSEGSYIDQLINFSEPETIRNLVLISSARHKNYRTVHALHTLKRLTEQKDWPDLLRRTLEEYPELSSAEKVLKNFNPDFDMGHVIYPELSNSVQDFALSMIQKFSGDKDLVSIAFELLDGNKSIDILVQKGLLNQSQSDSLKQLINLFKINDNNPDTYGKYYYVNELIANSCKDLYISDLSKKNENDLNDLTKIERLVKYSENLANIKNMGSDSLLLRSDILAFAINEISDEQFNILLSEIELIHSVVSGLGILHSPDKLKLFLNNPSIAIFKILNQLDLTYTLPFIQDVEIKIGEQLNRMQNSEETKKEFTRLFINKEIKKINTLLSKDGQIEVGKYNWESMLIAYIQSQTHNFRFDSLSQASTEKINELFSNPKVRNICLNGFRDLWISHLESGKPEEIPFSLVLLTEFIHECEGAGPLSQIDSLSSFIYDFRKVFSNETINNDIKIKAINALLEVEQRFDKERFSNQDRTEFYNISRDFLNIDLELFSDITQLFKELNPSHLKEFQREIYPLYRVMIVLDNQNLSDLKNNIEGLSRSISSGDFSVELHKQILIDQIKSIFKDKMGIIKVPEELKEDHISSIKNISYYLASIHDRDSQKEAILSLFLSLKLNGQWDDFISGKDIDIDELLAPEKVQELLYLLEQRKQLNPLTSSNLGILENDIPEFMKVLQREEEKIVIGNIETIDVKLGNIVVNLQGLIDLDLYNNPLDRQRMQLLIDWGNKKINSAIAKIYQSLENPDRNIQFSEEEEQIKQQIAKIVQDNNLTLTKQALKQYFQDEMRPYAAVINLLTFVESEKAQQEIDSLRSLLEPTQEVIDIFQRFGEDFKPTSGAMALSQDLQYLDNLIVKKTSELKPEEISLLQDYISKIRERIVLLEEVYNKIKDKFTALRQGMISRENPLLEEKFNQISAIINAQTTQQTVTSTMTHDLNTMIENIRECLSCSIGGFNNDTNLTFGDTNKFFITSRSETQTTGSIADQIVFLEPITRADGLKEISFVLDKIYGQNTPIILENHVDTILSKVRQIKKRFPNIKLSIFVTHSALSSSGTSSDMFINTLSNKKIQAVSETVNVNVVNSAFGDHYIEFGGGERSFGERSVNGVIITF